MLSFRMGCQDIDSMLMSGENVVSQVKLLDLRLVLKDFTDSTDI